MEKITLEELSNEWLLSREKFVKESTYSIYCTHVGNHIVPQFGNLICQDITSDGIQNRINTWLSRNEQNQLSEKTIKDIITILKSILKYGVKKMYIPNTDFDFKIPNSMIKIKRKKIVTYTLKEQKIIYDAVSQNISYKNLGILFCLYTGIRIGEVCALKWKDIDFTNNVVYISKTLQRIYIRIPENDMINKGYSKITITSPKTISVERIIPISSELINIVEMVKPEDLDTYFLTGTTKFIEPRTYRNYYKKFITSLDINVLKFHSLRHSFATRCIEAGADYKTVSELLGHTSVNITMNLYVHPSIEQKRKCIEMVSLH